MGFQQLLLHHHRRRTHLEGDCAGLSAADDCGHRARLPRQVCVGLRAHGSVHGARDSGQPRADDLLLSVHRAVHGHSLSRRGSAPEADGAFRQGYGCMRGGGGAGRGNQPLQPLPYVAVHAGVDARQERAGEEELCQPDFERPRPRLHHAVELRHRRDLDAARAQHQGRRFGAAGAEREGYGESQPRVLPDISADGSVLGRPAGHKRSGVRRSVRDDALRAGSVHSERPDEVGAARCDGALRTALVGQKLHVVHRPFPRLCAYVRQVPHRGVDTCHRRVHHSAAGYAGAEEGVGDRELPQGHYPATRRHGFAPTGVPRGEESLVARAQLRAHGGHVRGVRHHAFGVLPRLRV